MNPTLTIEKLCAEAARFSEIESTHHEATLYGVTDGKTVGNYLEHKFTAYLAENYSYQPGNSASGIDFPDLEVDIKVTSVKQPQSSCPFKSATQKVFGLGYHLLVFVYDKYDDADSRTARLDMQHTVFIDKSRTADFQTTKGILDILSRDGNKDDIIAFLEDRNLPVDEIGVNHLADKILKSPPNQGYLTISNALQWRLQYGRIIQQAGNVLGIIRVQ
jgi:hypothetical protein